MLQIKKKRFAEMEEATGILGETIPDIAGSTPLKLKVGSQESDVPVDCSQIVVETLSRSLIRKIRIFFLQGTNSKQ